MNIKVKVLLVLSLLVFIDCGKTIIKVNNPARVIDPVEDPDYKKTYFSYADGFVEYTRPVTPNKPQSMRGFTSKTEKEKHLNPVCANNVDVVTIYPDFADAVIHGIFGGIVSTRSVLVYCSK